MRYNVERQEYDENQFFCFSSISDMMDILLFILHWVKDPHGSHKKVRYDIKLDDYKYRRSYHLAMKCEKKRKIIRSIKKDNNSNSLPADEELLSSIRSSQMKKLSSVCNNRTLKWIFSISKFIQVEDLPFMVLHSELN